MFAPRVTVKVKEEEGRELWRWHLAECPELVLPLVADWQSWVRTLQAIRRLPERMV